MRIQGYVLTRTLAGVGVALAVVASVIVLVNFVELSRTLGSRADLGFLRLMAMALLKTPIVILLLMPFVFLFGVMGAFVALNRRNELIAMRAAGVSAWRFTFPAVAGAFLVGVLSVGVLSPFAAALNAAFEDQRSALTDESRSGRGEIWLRQNADGVEVVIHGRSRDRQAGSIRLNGVSIFVQAAPGPGRPAVSRRIEADQAVLEPGGWRLTHVREARPGSDFVESETLALPSPLDSRTAMEKFVSPGAVSSWDLPATIRSAELAGYSSAAYRLRLQQMLATPLLLAAMTLLAAGFSLRLLRLGDLPALAASGVALGFAFFFLNQFCGALGATGTIPTVLAAWTPPMLALLSAVTLLCHTEDG